MHACAIPLNGPQKPQNVLYKNILQNISLYLNKIIKNTPLAHYILWGDGVSNFPVYSILAEVKPNVIVRCALDTGFFSPAAGFF